MDTNGGTGSAGKETLVSRVRMKKNIQRTYRWYKEEKWSRARGRRAKAGR